MEKSNDGKGSGGRGGPEVRRPLLGGGEHLREVVTIAQGGRPKFHPHTLAEAHALLAPQAGSLAKAVTKMPQALRARHIVFEATLLPNYLAPSYFPTALLEAHSLYPVGTRQATGVLKTKKKQKDDAPTKTILIAGDPAHVLSFANAAMRRPVGEKDPEWSKLRELSEIRLATPDDIVKAPKVALGDGEVITWETVLNPIGRNKNERSDLEPEAFLRWVKHIRDLDGDVDIEFRRELGGVIFVPIALHAEAIHEAARFNLVRAIRPMPSIRPYRPTFRRTASSSKRPTPPAADARPLTNERVAIFDGGINQLSPYLQPFVTAEDLTTAAPTSEDMRHGSMVTSAFLFGHIAPTDTVLQTPVAYVDHFRVLPLAPSTKFDHGLYQCLDSIKNTVRERKYKFVNLSLGPDEVVDDGDPHYWTSQLDTLAEELGVTFFLAAGNNGNEDGKLGFNRVQVPGDMVNGLAIGATSTHAGKKAVRASYSAIGPGRAGQRVQPICVAFGGCDELPFGGLDQRGRYVESAGTSLASPLAMRGAVQLGTILGKKRTTPSAIRSFSAHFSERAQRGHNSIELGFGRIPSSYNEIFACAPHEVSVIYQDTLARDEVVAMRLPVPRTGIDEFTTIEIDWTIAFTSKIDPSDATDYTLSSIEEIFRPHDLIRSATRKDESMDVRLDKIDTEQLVLDGWTISYAPKAHSNRLKSGHESSRRAAGKWETILRGRVRFSASDLYLPRLDLIHTSRDDGGLTRKVPPLNMTMVATIRADANVPLYDLVRQQFRILSPIATHLPVRIITSA
ncbi:S8 family peptidase [Myxococcus eversor]|uniref:S8 family peptidase n=1 Tax=Myxococcus eversor TaxID=2709661 RepID=UPI0013D4A998|nr:S8 family peptidase [Myxococcus eversor]